VILQGIVHSTLAAVGDGDSETSTRPDTGLAVPELLLFYVDDNPAHPARGLTCGRQPREASKRARLSTLAQEPLC
jgi:hypothetical protein